MEVGEQHIDRSKRIRRIDEDVGLAAESSGLGYCFEHARGGRPDADNPPPAALGLLNRVPCVLLDRVALGVHRMIFGTIALDRLKRTRADMQRDFDYTNALAPQRFEQSSVEV